MRYMVLGLVATLVVGVGSLLAQHETNPSNKSTTPEKGQKATITHVDPQKGEVTVRMQDKDGKEVTRTFKLTEDVRMLDSNGRVAGMDVFRSGDYVLVVEEEGRLRELHKTNQTGNTNTEEGNKNPGGGRK